jgi:DNA-binding NarL/FixJ family response regulator
MSLVLRLPTHDGGDDNKGMTDQRERVLVLDSQPVWLRAVESILQEAGFGTASTTSWEEVVQLLRRQQFVALMVGIDDRPDWERVLGRVRNLRAAPKVIVVSVAEDAATVNRALEIGADAFIVKRAQPDDVVFAVRQVLAPEVYEVRPTTEEASARSRGSQQFAGLTPREQEILALVAQGRSNAEIAKALSISEPTVKGHLWRLYRKIGVSNRTAAARWVARSQLLDID